jgi:hypothetical protein
LHFLAEENFHGDILRGLRLRDPNLDVVRVQDIGLSGADDQETLAWAAANERILLTRDRATMPGYAHQRVGAGEPLAGVFLLERRPAGWRSDRRHLARRPLQRADHVVRACGILAPLADRR